MKKGLGTIVCLVLLLSLALPVFAAGEAPKITLQPQSPSYTNYAVAIYTVKATGSNLTATWYMQWQGKTYTISEIGGAMQDWEAYAGESYGARKLDDNTFAFTFEGIEKDLDGAYIWCVIEDGHYDVTSQKALISVGSASIPPEILSIPAELTVVQGEEAEIRCVAKAPEGKQLTYLWYETDSGRLEDMRAVDRGTEDGDFLACDTSMPGTRNYLCKVETSDGGLAYTSYVPVTVTERSQTVAAPTIQTRDLPEATAGEGYSVKLQSTDPAAQYSVWFDPGKDNDFEKTGLKLDMDGTISGTPSTPGSYSFCICAAGTGGEDYAVYTLTVKEAAPAETETTEATEPATQSPTSSQGETTAPTATEKDRSREQTQKGIPWWVTVLVGVVCAGGGVALAVALTKKEA